MGREKAKAEKKAKGKTVKGTAIMTDVTVTVTAKTKKKEGTVRKIVEEEIGSGIRIVVVIGIVIESVTGIVIAIESVTGIVIEIKNVTRAVIGIVIENAQEKYVVIDVRRKSQRNKTVRLRRKQ